MRTVKIVSDDKAVEVAPDVARHLLSHGKARLAPADPPAAEEQPAAEPVKEEQPAAEPVKPAPKTRKKAEDAGPDPASS